MAQGGTARHDVNVVSQCFEVVGAAALCPVSFKVKAASINGDKLHRARAVGEPTLS